MLRKNSGNKKCLSINTDRLVVIPAVLKPVEATLAKTRIENPVISIPSGCPTKAPCLLSAGAGFGHDKNKK